MTMVTRRQFFLGNFKAPEPEGSASHASSGSGECRARVRSCPEVEAIYGDFPADMLALEAQRLGLPPDTLDRSDVLAAIYAAMNDNARPVSADSAATNGKRDSLRFQDRQEEVAHGKVR